MIRILMMILTALIPSYDSYPDMIRTTLTLSLPSFDAYCRMILTLI
jgi:hypothetical protein